jgi:hypothetical protein
MHFARSVPHVAVEREISVPEVALARRAVSPRPGWYPVLLKAFAVAASRIPDLRRSLLTFPYPRLYEHACSVAAIAVEREVDGEPVVLAFHVRQPEILPLPRIDAVFNRAKSAPLEDVAEFRRIRLLLRLPRPVRRLIWWLGLRTSGSWRQKYWGTFGTSSVVSAGGTGLFPISPLTSVFTFGPVKPDGSLLLRLMFDHRVLDGVAAARGLAETENALRTVVLGELRSLAGGWRYNPPHGQSTHPHGTGSGRSPHPPGRRTEGDRPAA